MYTSNMLFEFPKLENLYFSGTNEKRNSSLSLGTEGEGVPFAINILHMSTTNSNSQKLVIFHYCNMAHHFSLSLVSYHFYIKTQQITILSSSQLRWHVFLFSLSHIRWHVSFFGNFVSLLIYQTTFFHIY